MQIDKYTPVTDSIIDKKVKQLGPVSVEFVETNLGVDQGLDGNKSEFSTLEKRLYASVAFIENNQSVLDGIYFYKLNMLIGGDKSEGLYSSGLGKLIELGKEKMGLTNAQVDGAVARAYFDYLCKHDSNGKQLINDLGKEKGTKYIEAIAHCWYDPSIESRNKILELAKDLVPARPPFPVATFSAFRNLCIQPLSDSGLVVAANKIQGEFNAGRDYKSVQLDQ